MSALHTPKKGETKSFNKKGKDERIIRRRICKELNKSGPLRVHHEVDRGRSNGCLRAMTVMETTATVLMPKSRETNIRQLRGVDGRECNNVSFLQKIPIRALYTVTENDRDS